MSFLYFLNSKFPVSSHLLCLYSLVCVGPVRKPHRWFSCEAAHLSLTVTLAESVLVKTFFKERISYSSSGLWCTIVTMPSGPDVKKNLESICKVSQNILVSKTFIMKITSKNFIASSVGWCSVDDSSVTSPKLNSV